MRRSGFALPVISMGLLYSSIYVGLIIINLRGSASDGRGDFSVLLHFALIALSASGLYFAAGKGIGRLRRPTMLLAALLALAGCVCVVLPFLSGDLAEKIFNGRPPILAMGMALFMPVGLFLFFRTIPAGKAGFSFACVIACSELLWALLFPLLGGISGGISPHLPGQQAFHLFSLCSWLIGCAGLCLAVSLARLARESAAAMQAGDSVQITDFAPGARKAARQKTYLALCLIFAAGLGVFAMMGLHMGMLMPKTAVLPKLIGIAHFAFLLLLPLAGRMLDENPGRLMLMGALGLAAVFLLGLLHEYGLIGRMPLFYTLNFMQSILLLTAYTATARLLRTHAVFPLVITLAHCLYMTHTGGVALRGLMEAVPHGVAAASLLLALGAALCLWRFRSLLAKEPELWALPLTGNTAAPVSEPGAGQTPDISERLASFGVAFALSNRELQVMEGIAQHLQPEQHALQLGIAESTIRYHQTGLFKKTGQPNRHLLALYFQTWKAE